MSRPALLPRRRFLERLALGTLAVPFTAIPQSVSFADELMQTPRQTEGPFYPDKLPLDTDNDLIVINDGLTAAVGEITHLSGRILDARGEPLRNAIVEIWQVDNQGAYLHSRSGNSEKRDGNFQGFGRFLTDATGGYYFRTIKPVPYPGRTPHIHMAVKVRGRDKFTTQCYIKGHALNEKDGVLSNVKDERARNSLLIDFTPLPNSRVGELAARFDVVLGFTPAG
jgi:protocatechuate 3,4-dioxygenase beta subunit